MILDLQFQILNLKYRICNLKPERSLFQHSNYMRRQIGIKFLAILFCIVFLQGLAHASPKKVKFLKEYRGYFVTTVKGTSKSLPPYLRVIRSKEGVSYLFNDFRKIRNLTTHNKALHLERVLVRNDFSKKMVVALLSQPTDNYKMEKVRIVEFESEQKLEVTASYFHNDKDYPIPPFKSIFYRFYVVKQSDLPVILNAELIKKKIKKSKKKPFKTIYGTLQDWEDNGKQLALINKSKRKKRVYYIKGSMQEELKQHVGKFLALRGEVIKDSESVYEADLTVKKIVKVYK